MLLGLTFVLGLSVSKSYATSPTCREERNTAVESCEKRLMAVKQKDPGQFSAGNSFGNTDQFAAANLAIAKEAATAKNNCESARDWFDKQCTSALKMPRANAEAIESQRRNGIAELNKLIDRTGALQAQYEGYAAGATAQNDERGDSTRVRAGVQPPHMFPKMESAAYEDQ